MSKLEPQNREEAFAHQIMENATTLMPSALANDVKGFNQGLERIEGMIQAYKSKSLRNKTKKAIAKTKNGHKWIEENNPSWIDRKHKKQKEHLKKFEQQSDLK